MNINEWLTDLIASGAITAAAIWLFQKFIISRIKYDFDRRLEELKPLTAEETLRRQNYLNSKRDAFFEALSILTEYLEATQWKGPDIPEDRPEPSVERPSEAKVNACYAKLSIYSDDPMIPETFLRCFHDASPSLLGDFVSKLRKDLGYDELPFTSDNDYNYYMRREPHKK